MQSSELRDVAAALRGALADSKPITAPSTTWPDLDADSAMEVQRLNVQEAVSNGDRLVGYKLGNIAKVMQDAFGLDQPDWGHLLASHFSYEGTTLLRENCIEPFVELEPAFVLRGPLRGPNVTVADVISAVDYVIPAIEIIDSRVENWAINLPDTLADNGSIATIMLGGPPRRVTDLNLSNTQGTLYFNGREVISGNTRNILGNPLAAFAWLVNRLAAYGIEFEAGQVVLPGSCLKAVPMNEAGHWVGTFEGFGSIEFYVS